MGCLLLTIVFLICGDCGGCGLVVVGVLQVGFVVCWVVDLVDSRVFVNVRFGCYSLTCVFGGRCCGC